MTAKDHEKLKKLSEKGTENYLGGDFWSWKTEKVVQIFSLPVKAVYWMLGEYEQNSAESVEDNTLDNISWCHSWRQHTGATGLYWSDPGTNLLCS